MVDDAEPGTLELVQGTRAVVEESTLDMSPRFHLRVEVPRGGTPARHSVPVADSCTSRNEDTVAPVVMPAPAAVPTAVPTRLFSVPPNVAIVLEQCPQVCCATVVRPVRRAGQSNPRPTVFCGVRTETGSEQLLMPQIPHAVGVFQVQACVCPVHT